MILRVHSFLSERMNRSTMAIEPCCPTAPNRGLMPRAVHQSRYFSRNCDPWSVMRYLGFCPTDLMIPSSQSVISLDRGQFLNSPAAIDLREK